MPSPRPDTTIEERAEAPRVRDQLRSRLEDELARQPDVPGVPMFTDTLIAQGTFAS
jgi:hypothetical protein